jgi:RHS repeat-associated protein
LHDRYDAHGSVRFLSSSTGDITDSYSYDAFGILIDPQIYDPNSQELEPVTVNNPQLATPNHYLYAGEQFDADLGLYYNRARYYNPQTGRFWTMDSYEGMQDEPPSLHKYAYCHADGVNGTDPSGKVMTLGETMVVGALVGGLLSATDTYIASRGQAQVKDLAASFLLGGAIGAVSGGIAPAL